MVRVLTVDGLDFPHATRVARVVRHRACLKTGTRGRETVYVITDPTRPDPTSREAPHNDSRRSFVRSGSSRAGTTS
ncbi:hypothetical protein OG568_41630 [Streptomyces sp. NBC_01450]|uniref:hypothetical protein n=1 Tax=Streptomyces sp. NBC_01450 TaxID=2903871 RepID=UPI002E33B7A8|nr:hypothetical protein [Streptomyces sp. NBC_01450]